MNIILCGGYALRWEHVFVGVHHKNAAQCIGVGVWVGVHMDLGMCPGRVMWLTNQIMTLGVMSVIEYCCSNRSCGCNNCYIVVHSNVIGHNIGKRKHPKPKRMSGGSGGKVVIQYEALEGWSTAVCGRNESSCSSAYVMYLNYNEGSHTIKLWLISPTICEITEELINSLRWKEAWFCTFLARKPWIFLILSCSY